MTAPTIKRMAPPLLSAKHSMEIGAVRIRVKGLQFQSETLPNG